MKIFRMVSILVVLSVSAMACTQDAPSPNFAGDWELNTKKGENLGMVAAVTQTLVVTQTAEQLTVDSTSVFQGKTSTRQVNYDLSGAPVTNSGAMGDSSETVSSWADSKLVTIWTSEGAVAGTEVVRTETRSLSADKNEMTVATARGDNPAMVLVFERQ